MVDVFMIHRATGVADQKARFELMKVKALNATLTEKLNELEGVHDRLVCDYLDDAAVMRATKAENDHLKQQLSRLKGIERAVSEDIAPTMVMTFLTVSKLNADIERWSEATTSGVPSMPIDPHMKQAFKMLYKELCKHIKGFDAETGSVVELGE